MMVPVSDALRGLLSRQGMHDRTVGAGMVVVNEGRGAATDGAHSQLKASNAGGGLGYSPIGRQGGTQPIRIDENAEAEASAKNRSRQRTGDPSPARGRPVLRLIVSSKCEPTHTQSERLPPLGVGSHLVLVVSN